MAALPLTRVREDAIRSPTIRVSTRGRRLAIQLTAARIGDYVSVVNVVDDFGALDALRLRHDATDEEIKSSTGF